MSESEPRGTLPYGWIVKTSRQYKDRVYYFNINTGASTWECPELDPPSNALKEQEKNMEDLHTTSDRTKRSSSDCSKFENKSRKRERPSCSEGKSPPTAVVVPVVHKHNSSNIVSKKEQPKRKLQSENLTDSQSKKKKYEKKRISPLNRPDNSEDSTSLCGNTDDDKSLLLENSIDSPSTSSLETSKEIKDIEMRDVSIDLIDDLTSKKETLFDTTACYYIVVDTNVLISELPLISELKDTPLDGCGPPHIFIPWIVIGELDKLKNQRNLKSSSRAAAAAAEAIRYLNSVLRSHPRFHGQSPAEAQEWAKSYSKNNDDKILECCEALKDKMPPEKVILLTNDKNLVNKALICKINVHNFESMMKKVKPDTVFNYEELKNDKKKRKEKERKPESESTSTVSLSLAEEKVLQDTQDILRREIHSLMSNARYLLKDVLYKFLEVEMFEAYGSVWTSFPIEKKLLKGILEGIKKYWMTVYSEFFSEKEQRNFELLLEKASRPEGYLGDKDECLVILSTIEDVFRQIQKRRPTIRVSVEIIKEYRIACVNAFTRYNEAENCTRALEEKSILQLFTDDWNAINQLTGLVLDYFNVPNDFHYVKFNGLLPEPEVKRILITLIPEIQQIKTLMCNLLDAVKDCKPTKKAFTKLASALLQFIPTLRVPYEPTTYPLVTGIALERFFSSTQHRRKIEVGIKQLEKFYEKLDEVLYSMLRGELRGPVTETMICD